MIFMLLLFLKFILIIAFSVRAVLTGSSKTDIITATEGSIEGERDRDRDRERDKDEEDDEDADCGSGSDDGGTEYL